MSWFGTGLRSVATRALRCAQAGRAISRTATLVAVLVVVCGCATPPRDSEAIKGWVNVPVRFVGPDGHEMPMLDRPDEWINALGIIPGGIFGEIRHQAQFVQMRAYDEQTGRFDFSELRAELAKRSTRITDAALAGGLRIEPANTRFARVSTSIGVRERAQHYAISLRENIASKDDLILAFFDRPCRLTGTLVGSGLRTYDVDVTVARAGLAWLKLSDSRLTNAAVPSDFMFVVRASGE